MQTTFQYFGGSNHLRSSRLELTRTQELPNKHLQPELQKQEEWWKQDNQQVVVVVVLFLHTQFGRWHFTDLTSVTLILQADLGFALCRKEDSNPLSGSSFQHSAWTHLANAMKRMKFTVRIPGEIINGTSYHLTLSVDHNPRERPL